MNLDRIKKNIRALLKTAGDDSLMEGETTNALAFARRLMLKHNVREQDLEEARDAHEIAADVEATEYGTAGASLNGQQILQWESDWLRDEKGIHLGRTRGYGGSSFSDEDAFSEGRADGRAANFSRERQGRIE